MKLLSWSEMMKMPQGTIYQEFKPMILGEVMIFGGPLPSASDPVDYVEAPLCPSARITGSPGDSIAYPIGFGRNGMFDRTVSFLVWERADAERIAGWLLQPEAALSQMEKAR